MVSIGVVATLFGVSAQFIGAIRRSPRRYYRAFKLKSGRKSREIHAPRVALKIIQKWIGTHLAAAITLPEYVFGFVANRSVFDAAQLHCGSHWVYSIDLRDFFPSISLPQVSGALIGIGYSEDAAALIGRMCTLDNALPQGSPASPVLSNLVFLKTDAELKALADGRGFRYSRYADDLVFSGSGQPPDDLATAVKAIVKKHGWTIAKEKEKLSRLPARLKVHGLLVHGSTPRLTKGYRNKIRAFQHLMNNKKISEEDRDRVQGHLAYGKMIQKRISEKA